MSKNILFIFLCLLFVPFAAVGFIAGLIRAALIIGHALSDRFIQNLR